MKLAETHRESFAHYHFRSSFGQSELIPQLYRAADQFIVARAPFKTTIAGYHWFGDWGRDTMIALPGLLLATDQPQIAKEILLQFVRYLDAGMLPNRFPDAGISPSTTPLTPLFGSLKRLGSTSTIEKMKLGVRRGGRVPVSEMLEVTLHPGIWSLGDCALIPDQEGGFHPPTAQHAIRQAKTLASNIAASLRNRPMKPFSFKTIGQLAAIGRRSGVAKILGWRFSGFVAWWMWRTIPFVRYLPQYPFHHHKHGAQSPEHT
jgi:hypothetical protein